MSNDIDLQDLFSITQVQFNTNWSLSSLPQKQ